MPYGPDASDQTKVSAGTLELLGQKAIVSRDSELGLADDRIASEEVWTQGGEAMEDAVDAVRDGVRIVIMNPPFTNRSKMGEKFPKETQQSLRKRVDALERVLVNADLGLTDFADKNALAPLFVALADKCLQASSSALTLIHPTIALTNPSGQDERVVLAQRFHIHTILTCHQPGNINMSQNTSINESIIVAKRSSGTKPATRFITLDRMPSDDSEVHDMHKALLECQEGLMKDGWGVVSHWPTERIESGDWTPAIWRSPELGEAASKFANDSALTAIKDISGVFIHSTYQTLLSNFSKCDAGATGAFPVLASKGAKGQSRITSTPDEYRTPKKTDEETVRLNGGIHPETKRMPSISPTRTRPSTR